MAILCLNDMDTFRDDSMNHFEDWWFKAFLYYLPQTRPISDPPLHVNLILHQIQFSQPIPHRMANITSLFL
jgi:hypothetical protein